MKKYLPGITIIVTTLMFSCKSDPKTDKQDLKEAQVDTTEVVDIEEEKIVEEKKPVTKKITAKKKKATTPKKEAYKVPAGAPTFSDAAARKYIIDYEKYVAAYKKAVEANDMESFVKLNDASKSLNQQYNALIEKLSAEELAKMSNYIQEKTQQLNELSEKMY